MQQRSVVHQTRYSIHTSPVSVSVDCIRPPRIFSLFCFLLLGVFVSGCGDNAEGGSGNAAFVFEPGPPGSAVGIVAILETGSDEVQSNEQETSLVELTDEQVESLRQQQSRSLPTRQMDLDQGDIRAQRQALCEPAPQKTDTLKGKVCFQGHGYQFGTSALALGLGGAEQNMLFYTRDGVYSGSSGGQFYYFPPDIASFGSVSTFGCFRSPNGITMEQFNNLNTYSASVVKDAGVVSTSVGIEVYFDKQDQYAGWGRTMGGSVGLDLISTLLVPTFNFPVSVPWDTGKQLGAADEELVSGMTSVPRLVKEYIRLCPETTNPLSGQGGYEFEIPPEPLNESEVVALDEVLIFGAAPVLDSFANPTGNVPAEHIAPGSNADAVQDWFDHDGACDDCPNTSLHSLADNFVQRMAGAQDNSSSIDVGAWVTQQAEQAIPSSDLIGSVLNKSSSAVQAGAEIAARQRAEESGSDHVFVSNRVEVIRIKLGQSAELIWTAKELGELIDRPAADLEGATITLSSFPTVDPFEIVVEDGIAGATYTPSDPVNALFKIKVDLSTAQGDFPEDVADWEIYPSMRLVITKAGAPSNLYLQAPQRVVSGGSVTLNATVVDDKGTLVDEPVTVRFEDAQGKVIGRATTRYGVASLQYVPVPDSPQIDEVVASTLSYGDEEVEGITISGSGFSVNAEIFLNGEKLDSDNYPRSVGSHKEVLLVVPKSEYEGGNIQVTNPGSLQSNVVAVVDK